jgi:hypothetical protein
MELHRLTPTSLAQVTAGYGGRCAACGESIRRRARIVYLYGEAFHRDCAFYRRGSIGARNDSAA